MSHFEGKTVLITGAARGQGRREAELFASLGAKVAICDVLADEARETAESLNAKGYKAKPFNLDVTQISEWETVVGETVAWSGSIDVLVNNAGILHRKTVRSYPLAEWQQVLDVNLTGTFLGVQLVGRHMCDRGSGSIVNIASNAAFSGHADGAYTASKWGVRGLTRSAAMEFASHGVRVNCVCPGLVVTDINRNAPHLSNMINMTPMGRPVEVDEIASVVVFLAGSGASMITGEDIVVDGGFTAGANYWRVSRDTGLY
jgi:3alpha(or 20beta)-hydroxysteroid dehydrogenase